MLCYIERNDVLHSNLSLFFIASIDEALQAGFTPVVLVDSPGSQTGSVCSSARATNPTPLSASFMHN